jgi:hypothetical protein
MGMNIVHLCKIPTSKSISIQHKESEVCPICQAEKALWEIKELHRNASGICFICSQIAQTEIIHPCETFNLAQPF